MFYNIIIDIKNNSKRLDDKTENFVTPEWIFSLLIFAILPEHLLRTTDVNLYMNYRASPGHDPVDL